ncbi:hypothetical protein BDW62DRAFT_200473 [Aspergillus aurantiobrunneus]
MDIDPAEQPAMVEDEEQRRMVSYHDMTAQPGSNEFPSHPPAHSALPYSHSAAMYLDQRGEPEVEPLSPMAAYQEQAFFIGQKNRDRFRKYANKERQPSLQNVHADMGLSNIPPTQHPSVDDLAVGELGSLLRRRAVQDVLHDKIGHGWEPPSPSPTPKRSTLRVGQTQLLRTYYEKAFDCFQQLNCRVIAKAFVKLVEPRKQVNYPYNGRKPGLKSTEKPDPEKTKPKWWPSGVRHKEPDHLRKPERIRLLIHILCELKDSHGVTAESLKDASQDVRRHITSPPRQQVLDEIFYVRGMEELYLEGKISSDATTLVSHVHMEDDLQGQVINDSVCDPSAMIATVRKDQQPVHRSRRSTSINSGDTHYPPLANRKRPAGSDFYQPMSPASSPAASRKSSLERNLPAYSSDIDPAVVSGPEPAGSPMVAQGLQPPGPSSLPDYFAHQFGTQSAGQSAHPGFWGTLPSTHPQFTFCGY